jgi:glyoxylase-like metal-dependent hydrolase (beta-lactamase superfamily II)
MRRILLFAFLTTFAAGLALAQDDMADVEIKTTKVTDHVAMLEGRGGNLAVFTSDDGVFLVDDQYAPLTEKILAAIAELSDQPVKFVLNTHWHGDHTGGNENLGKMGTIIVSHENVRARLTEDQFSAFFDRTVPASPEGAWPVVTFTEGLSFWMGGEEIAVWHAPHGHTDGDGVVWFKTSNVIHSGDLIFYGLFPYIDASAGGSIDGMIAGVERILASCDAETRIIPGHGPLLSPAQVEEYLAMLKDIRGRVADLKAEGRDLAAVQAAKPAAAYDEGWGQVWITADQIVQFIYDTLP